MTALIPLLLASMSGTAAAANRTVGAGASYDHSTIQAAINASSNGDRVIIASGTWSEALDTKGRNLTLTAASGATVTIQAPSSTALTITRGETVTVTDLRFANSDQGIEVRGSTLFLTDSTVTNNSGLVAGAGLGIFEGSTAIVQGCTISDNTAEGGFDGGGLNVDSSTIEIADTDILDNNGDRGGGMLANLSDVTLDQVTFRRNAAQSQGGAIRLGDQSSLDAIDVTMTDNVAGTRGGGIASYLSDTTWLRASIENNAAGTAGGGLAFDGVATSGSTFTGDVIGNTAGGSGGGLLVEDHPLTIRSSTLSDNEAGETANGGAISAYDSRLSLVTVTLSGNSAVDGGAIWLERNTGTASLVGSALTVEGNSASGDGGAFWSGVATSVTNSDLDNNAAGSDGGALFIDSAWLTLTNTRMDNNEAAAAGGAIMLSDGFLTFTNVALSSNTAQYGGGAYLDGGRSGTGTVTGLRADDNLATADGGGLVFTSFASLTATGLSADQNTCGSVGGGIRVSGVRALSLTDVLATGNSGRNGGGLHIGSSAGNLTRIAVGGNVASVAGGGLQLDEPDGILTVRNVLAWENTSAEGAGVYLQGDDLGGINITQLTAAGNQGPGITLQQCTGSRIHNSVAEDNTGEGIVGDADSSTSLFTYVASSSNTTDWAGSFDDRIGTNHNSTTVCDYAGLTRNGDWSDDRVTFSSVSQCRDAGDRSVTDIDGSISDPGHLGGPDAWDNDLDEDGVTISDGDCDDANADVTPGGSDTWYDGVDADCAGDDDYDADLDGWPVPDDCDDGDPNVHPGAVDSTVDGVDQDCDGDDAGEELIESDDDDPVADGQDNDGDGYSQDIDCDDADPTANPGSAEVCDDGLDNDCDGYADDFDNDCVNKADDCGCTSVHGTAPLTTLFGWGLGLALALRRRVSPRPS